MKWNSIPKAALCLITPLIIISTVQALSFNDLWINEFHYDNDGSDVGEFVEIAARAGADLTGLSLTRYDGSNFSPESSILDLSDATIDTVIDSIRYLVFDYSSLENGPEGFALAVNSSLIQFISYESSFTGSGGIADGIISHDIGVSETSSTPVGHSLQLTGSGSSYPDFAWSLPAAQTRGFANQNQFFVTSSHKLDDKSPSSVPASGSTAGFLGYAIIALLTVNRWFLKRAKPNSHP